MGGPGSGYFEHAGRPGLVGGSSGGGGGGGSGGAAAKERAEKHRQARESLTRITREAEVRIAETLAAYEESKTETTFIFDTDGNLLLQGTENKPDSTVVPSKEVARDRIVIHNHPNQSPPSFADFEVAIESSAKEERILTGGYQ